MSLPTTSKAFILQNPPTGPVDLGTGPDATFTLKQVDLPPVKDNQLLVQTVFISNDPAQRGYIQKDADPERAYVPPIRAGEVMSAFGVGKVLKSTSADISEGDLIYTRTVGWREYAILDAKDVKKLAPLPGLSPSIFLGALGGPGLTAYFGLVDVLKFQKGQSLVVSGGAGAVGNIVVQYAKHVLGASKVVAIAGSDEKCEWLKKLGADYAINYKSPNFENELKDATEGYVDAYFDNVGGPILNLMYTRVKRFGRIAACGAISSYNDSSQNVYPNYMEVIKNRLTIQGFIVIDYIATRYSEGIDALVSALKAGKISVENAETIKEVSFEEIPQVWGLLFTGGNTGKLVTQVAKV